MTVHIQIERFEGPLALLLHLIRKEEMDIFDINVNAITKQYLEYIKKMKKLNLEVAGEFIAMAATLIQIKSRMLLPSYNDDGEEIETEDPRKELVQRLLEYQAFQDVSQRLYERPLLGRDIWVRGSREVIEADKEEEIITEENALFSLIVSYRKAVKNMKKAVHKVAAELQSIAERVNEIRHYFVKGAKLRFFDLITVQEKGEKRSDQVLITFLSMLELAKVGIVGLFQSESFGEIHIEAKVDVEDDALARVEDYESPNQNLGAAEISISEDDLSDSSRADDNPDQMTLGEAPSTEFDDLENGMAGEEGSFSVDAATDDEILAEELLMEAEDHSEVHTDILASEELNVISVKDLENEMENENEFQAKNSIPSAPEGEPDLGGDL